MNERMLVILSCLVGATSACGNDKPAEPGIEVAPQEITRAAEATLETRGARFTSTSVERIARPEQEKLGGPVVSTSVDTLRAACAGSIDSVRSTDIECRPTPRKRGSRYRIIEVGGVYYYDGPGLLPRVHTKKWIETRAFRTTRVSLVRGWARNPVALARVLAAAGPRLVGTQTLQGVPTRHYAATVDRHEFAKLVRRRDPARLGYDVITGLRVEAWVDGRNLIRRTRARMHYESFTDVVPDPPNKTLFVQTSEFRFSPQSRIAPPPARDTENASLVRRKLGR